MVEADAPRLTYQELLAAAEQDLRQTGQHTVELDADQSAGLMTEVVRRASDGLPAGKVDVRSLQVAIEDQTVRVDTALVAGIGPITRDISGSLTIINTPNSDTQVETSSVTTVPPVIELGRVARGAIGAAAKVMGHDIDVPPSIDLARALQSGLERRGGLGGAFQGALNGQLPPDVQVGPVDLHVTEQGTLKASLRRNGPASQ